MGGESQHYFCDNLVNAVLTMLQSSLLKSVATLALKRNLLKCKMEVGQFCHWVLGLGWGESQARTICMYVYVSTNSVCRSLEKLQPSSSKILVEVPEVSPATPQSGAHRETTQTYLIKLIPPPLFLAQQFKLEAWGAAWQ